MLKKLAAIGLAASIEIALVLLAPMATMAQTTAGAKEIQCIKTVDGEPLQGAAFRNAITACEPKAAVAKQKGETVFQKKMAKARESEGKPRITTTTTGDADGAPVTKPQ
jgi:hypothetical protein